MLFVYASLILMILFWSFSFIIVDIAIEYTPPLSIALYRFVIAGLAFILINLILKLRNKLNHIESKVNNKKIRFTKNEWILALIGSFTGASIFFVAQYTSIQLIGPSLPALFVCLIAPIIVTIFSLIFFKDEKMNKIKIIGFIIATIGGFLLVTGGDIRNLTPESPNFLGYIAALMTPILWAIYSTVMKQLSKSKPNSDLKILEYISYLGSIQLLIFVLMNGEFIIFLNNLFNPILFLCAAYLGVGCYIIGYYIWQTSQKKLKSSKVASFLYIEPFITLILSYIFQRSEVIVFWNILGGIIVLVAVLLINYKQN